MSAGATGLDLLRVPFPPEQVGKLPKGGVFLDFVGHADVTARLLDADPEWSWEPFAVGPDGLPAVDREGNLWIRLTVCGVTRIGVGDGTSAKIRIGDALRNAAMRFGAALDLWAKGDRQYADTHDTPTAAPPPYIIRVFQAVQNLEGQQRLDLRAWYDERGFPADLKQLSEDDSILVCDYIASMSFAATDRRHPDDIPLP